MRVAHSLAGGLRGGGSAPFEGGRWGDESAELAKRFEVEALTPAQTVDLEQSAILAELESEPDVAFEEERTERVDLEASRGERVWRRSLAPRHRRAVREFFAEDPSTEENP